MTLRILLFSSTYHPLVGGVETVTRRLAGELKDRGHEVCVITNRYPRSLPPYELVDGIRVIRRRYPNILPSPGRRRPITILKQIMSMPLATAELVYLYAFISRFRPQIVNVHYFSYPAAFALLAARLRGLSPVLCFHGSDVPSTPYPATYRLAGRWGCSLAQEIICCSDDLRSYLVRDLPAQKQVHVTVSHYGIDPASGDEAVDPPVQEPFVLLMARLVEKKGVDTAIRAVADLGRRSIPVRLVILGSGPLQPALEGLAQDLGVGSNVTFAGSVAHGAARALLEQALFVIVPSHWEAFGMVCLEAMMAKKAVIGSRNGGIREIVVDGETGLLVKPNDSRELAKALETLLNDPARAAAMGARGRERAVTRFTWKAMIDRYEAVFDRVLAFDRTT